MRFILQLTFYISVALGVRISGISGQKRPLEAPVQNAAAPKKPSVQAPGNPRPTADEIAAKRAQIK
jgi:hypothetical protein